MIVLLAQPDLADAEVVARVACATTSSTTIDCLRVGKQHDSSRHSASNAQAELAYSDVLGLIGSLASQYFAVAGPHSPHR